MILSDIDERKDLFIMFEWKRFCLMRHMPFSPHDFKSYNAYNEIKPYNNEIFNKGAKLQGFRH